MVVLEPFLGSLLPLPLPFLLQHQICLCPGTHLGIVQVVGATVLGKLAEGFKPGGIREVRANSTWEGAGAETVNTGGAPSQRAQWAPWVWRAENGGAG